MNLPYINGGTKVVATVLGIIVVIVLPTIIGNIIHNDIRYAEARENLRKEVKDDLRRFKTDIKKRLDKTDDKIDALREEQFKLYKDIINEVRRKKVSG